MGFCQKTDLYTIIGPDENGYIIRKSESSKVYYISSSIKIKNISKQLLKIGMGVFAGGGRAFAENLQKEIKSIKPNDSFEFLITVYPGLSNDAPKGIDEALFTPENIEKGKVFVNGSELNFYVFCYDSLQGKEISFSESIKYKIHISKKGSIIKNKLHSESGNSSADVFAPTLIEITGTDLSIIAKNYFLEESAWKNGKCFVNAKIILSFKNTNNERTLIFTPNYDCCSGAYIKYNSVAPQLTIMPTGEITATLTVGANRVFKRTLSCGFSKKTDSLIGQFPLNFSFDILVHEGDKKETVKFKKALQIKISNSSIACVDKDVPNSFTVHISDLIEILGPDETGFSISSWDKTYYKINSSLKLKNSSKYHINLMLSGFQGGGRAFPSPPLKNEVKKLKPGESYEFKIIVSPGRSLSPEKLNEGQTFSTDVSMSINIFYWDSLLNKDVFIQENISYKIEITKKGLLDNWYKISGPNEQGYSIRTDSLQNTDYADSKIKIYNTSKYLMAVIIKNCGGKGVALCDQTDIKKLQSAKMKPGQNGELHFKGLINKEKKTSRIEIQFSILFYNIEKPIKQIDNVAYDEEIILKN